MTAEEQFEKDLAEVRVQGMSRMIQRMVFPMNTTHMRIVLDYDDNRQIEFSCELVHTGIPKNRLRRWWKRLIGGRE